MMARPFEFFAVFLEQVSGFLSGRPRVRPEDEEIVHGCWRPGCGRMAVLALRGRHYCRLHRPPLAPLVPPAERHPGDPPPGTGEEKPGDSAEERARPE